MSFLGSLYAAAATDPKRCNHKHVIALGSEETGLRSLYCERCRTPMARYVFKGQYVYRPIGSRKPPSDRAHSSPKRAITLQTPLGPVHFPKGKRAGKLVKCAPCAPLTGIRALDRLFMAAAPALEPKNRDRALSPEEIKALLTDARKSERERKAARKLLRPRMCPLCNTTDVVRVHGQLVCRHCLASTKRTYAKPESEERRPLSFMDRLFMAAAPASEPKSNSKGKRKDKRKSSVSPAEPHPFKPLRRAPARRVKLLTTAKHPLGSRHMERVAEIGPYVPGFYTVKNESGKAIVYRRSAVEMRRYPAHLGYPCP